MTERDLCTTTKEPAPPRKPTIFCHIDIDKLRVYSWSKMPQAGQLRCHEGWDGLKHVFSVTNWPIRTTGALGICHLNDFYPWLLMRRNRHCVEHAALQYWR